MNFKDEYINSQMFSWRHHPLRYVAREDELAAQARGRRHVRPGGNVVDVEVLLGEKDGRDARRGASEGRLGPS